MTIVRKKAWAAALLLLGASWTAQADAPAASEGFVQLLKKTAAERQTGAVDPKPFFARLSELAKQGDPAAQFLLGMGFFKDRKDLAEQYMSAAAQSGCAGAVMGLGLLAMDKGQAAQGVAHFKRAAEQGDAMAPAAISGLYERGEHGFEKSLSKSLAWLRLAERQTASSGALMGIKDVVKRLRSSMSVQELAAAEAEFATLAARIPKHSYYFCGQFNLDTSADPSVPDYFKF